MKAIKYLVLTLCVVLSALLIVLSGDTIARYAPDDTYMSCTNEKDVVLVAVETSLEQRVKSLIEGDDFDYTTFGVERLISNERHSLPNIRHTGWINANTMSFYGSIRSISDIDFWYSIDRTEGTMTAGLLPTYEPRFADLKHATYNCAPTTREHLKEMVKEHNSKVGTLKF